MFEINPYYQLLNATNTVHSNRILGYVLGMDTTIIFCSLIAKSYYYKERDMLDDGWFYCTVLDLEESTTYGKKTQDRAIKRLIDEGLIEYKRAGLPAKRYFRLTNDFNSLCRVIQEGEKKGLEIREKRRKSENSEKPDNMRNSDNTSKNGQPTNGYNSSSSNLDYLDSPIGTNLMNQNGLTGSTNLDEHTYNHNKINHKEDGYTCFEEDCAAAVAFRELIDKDLFRNIDDYFRTNYDTPCFVLAKVYLLFDGDTVHSVNRLSCINCYQIISSFQSCRRWFFPPSTVYHFYLLLSRCFLYFEKISYSLVSAFFNASLSAPTG